MLHLRSRRRGTKRWGLKREHQVCGSRRTPSRTRRAPKRADAWADGSTSAASPGRRGQPSLAGRIRRPGLQSGHDGSTAIFQPTERRRAPRTDAGLVARPAREDRGLGCHHGAWRSRTSSRPRRAASTCSTCAAITGPRSGVRIPHRGRRRHRDTRLLHDHGYAGDRSLRDSPRPARAGRRSRTARSRALAEKPLNPTAGLIGTGHPISATGVRIARYVVTGHRQDGLRSRHGRSASPQQQRRTTDVSFVIPDARARQPENHVEAWIAGAVRTPRSRSAGHETRAQR